jgi:biotin carboxylase
MLLVMVLFFIEKICGHHVISKFKLWLTVMEYLVFIRKRMQHTTSPSKVIEEAPSCFNTRLRKKMGGAVLVAKSCDYLGAGTVEFYGRKYFFFSRNEYPFAGGTSCDGMDYWTGFSRITNQGS